MSRLIINIWSFDFVNEQRSPFTMAYESFLTLKNFNSFHLDSLILPIESLHGCLNLVSC
jgi:hypothetical protein